MGRSRSTTDLASAHGQIARWAFATRCAWRGLRVSSSGAAPNRAWGRRENRPQT
jgi:hypothetical protein